MASESDPKTKMKRILSMLGCVGVFVASAVSPCVVTAQVKTEPAALYKDAAVPVDRRVDDLLSRMTLEEKIMQLCQYTAGGNTNENNVEVKADHPLTSGSYIYYGTDPGFRNRLQRRIMTETRLGIPAIFAQDVIHGFRTIYQIPLGQACSFNPGLAAGACAMAAAEARRSGIEWTFSPMVDVARDGRWGRISEGYGEDPYMNSVMGAAAVRGYQGESLASGVSVAACLKHYVGYGASEGGRDYRPADISDRALWNTYLPPFHAGVEAGAATVMSGFNDISGVPASANYYTLTEILRNRWGFDGFVVSDWDSVRQLVNQRVASDDADAAMLALNAGVDVDMADGLYADYLARLIGEGKVSMDRVDRAVAQVLKLKFELGLFDNPYTPAVPAEERVLTPGNRRIALEMARESAVLLKNEGNLLPLAGKKIALIGPMADDGAGLNGNWSCHGVAAETVTFRQALTRTFPATVYARGCGFDSISPAEISEAVRAAQEADVVVLCLGEMPKWSGENGSRSTLSLPDAQERLAAEISAVGKPVVLVLTSGRPLELRRLEPMAGAVLQMWQPGTEGGTALAEILSGEVCPSGKLAVTFPYSTGQVPIYYGARPNARTGGQGNYQDIQDAPLYPFGYGLSYTEFSYSNLRVSAPAFTDPALPVEISVDVTNTGRCTGKETALWFVSDEVSAVARPVRELRHFEKRELQPGETATFTFSLIPSRDLPYYTPDGEPVLEPGRFTVSVAGLSIPLDYTPAH